MEKRIALLGAGSGYFITAIGEIALTEELDGSTLILYDINRRRMELVAGVGKRLIQKSGLKISIETTTQLERGVDGVDFAVSSIGSHAPNMSAHLADMELSARYGIIQTTGDTVGPGGLSICLRLIPAYIEVCRELARRSPQCILLNHSNPMNPICRAITKYTEVRQVVGLCHGGQGAHQYLAGVLGVPHEELQPRSAGLNHLLWLLSLRYRGEELLPRLAEEMEERSNDEGHRFAWHIYRIFGQFPVNADRHIIEFFPYLRQCSKPEGLPYGLEFRAETLRDAGKKRKERFEELRKQAEDEIEVELPEEVSPENIGNLIASLALSRREARIVNIQNDGSIPNLPDFANVEVEGVTEDGGVRGLYMGPIPENVVGPMIARVYQMELMVDSAVKGDRRLALHALAQDPLILSLDEAESLLNDLIDGQRDYLSWTK